jgi:hypothetical protein
MSVRGLDAAAEGIAVAFRGDPPCFSDSSIEPSVEPLSAITISPITPAFSMPRRAFSMQATSVSASLRQGMTMLRSKVGSMARSRFETLRYVKGRSFHLS